MRSFAAGENRRCTQWYIEDFPLRKTSRLLFLLSYGVRFHGVMSIRSRGSLIHEPLDAANSAIGQAHFDAAGMAMLRG